MMGGGNQSHGFTIVEVMFVLAITAVMLIGAFTLVSGKQNQTEFDQSIQDIKSQLQQRVNDVEQGSYNTPPNAGCNVTPVSNWPQLFRTSGSGGHPENTSQNELCNFLGNAIHFYESSIRGSTPNPYASTYPIIGRGCSLALPLCGQVQSLEDALPVVAGGRALGGGYGGNTEDWGNQMTFQNSAIKVSWMTDAAGNNICSLAFAQDPALTVDGSNIVSSAGALNLYSIPDTSGTCSSRASGQASDDAVQEIDCTLDTTYGSNLACGSNPANPNPVPKVDICFQSTTTSQSGLIEIDSNSANYTPTGYKYSSTTLQVNLTIYGDLTC